MICSYWSPRKKPSEFPGIGSDGGDGLGGFAGVLLGQVELLGKLEERGSERCFGIRQGPENVAVIVPVKVRELDGRLRLANAAKDEAIAAVAAEVDRRFMIC